MSCYWCKDERFALDLLLQLSEPEQKGNEAWERGAKLDLCYCQPCVQQYHRLKREFLKKYPKREKTLYGIEVERLENHFYDARKETRQSTSPDNACILEEYLKVPVFEMLNYPYLLFNEKLLNVFVDSLKGLIENDKFTEIEDKLSGVYLLLFSPHLEIRKWALQNTKSLGTISIENFHELSPVINCILKIVLYGLLDNRDVRTDSTPMTSITDKTFPVPHLYSSLSKKDMWLGLGAIFRSLDENALRMLLNMRGNSEVLRILRDMLESNDIESVSAFWPLLFCLKVLMQKLESTFWFLMNVNDAFKTTFRLVLKHPTNKAYLKSLAVQKVVPSGDSGSENNTSFEEIALSQLMEGKMDSSQQFDPFLWIQPYIVAVLDFESITDIVTQEIVSYFISLIETNDWFTSHTSPSKLDLVVLKCLFSLIKYLVDKHLLCRLKVVSGKWLDILRHLRFEGSDFAARMQSKSWNSIWRKSQKILVALFSQGEQLAEYRLRGDISRILNWLTCQKEGEEYDHCMVDKLMQYLPIIVKNLIATSNDGISALSLRENPGKLFSTSSDEGNVSEAQLTMVARKSIDGRTGEPKPGCSNEPICISDSDDDVDDQEASKQNPEKSVFEPISDSIDLDYSSESEHDTADDDDNEANGEKNEAGRESIRQFLEFPLNRTRIKNADDASSVEEHLGGQSDKEKTRQYDASEGHESFSRTPSGGKNIKSDSSEAQLQAYDVKREVWRQNEGYSYQTILSTDSESDAKSPVLKMKTPVRYTYGKGASRLANVGRKLDPRGENVSANDEATNRKLLASTKLLAESLPGISRNDYNRHKKATKARDPAEGWVNCNGKCRNSAGIQEDEVTFLYRDEVLDSSSDCHYKDSRDRMEDFGTCTRGNSVKVKAEEVQPEAMVNDNNLERSSLPSETCDAPAAKEVSSVQAENLRSPFEGRGAFDFLTGLQRQELSDSDGGCGDKEGYAAAKSLVLSHAVDDKENSANEVEREQAEPFVDDADMPGENDADKDYVNLSSEMFQKRKAILYEQFVKKRKLLGLEGENEVPNGAGSNSPGEGELEEQHAEAANKNSQKEHLPDMNKSKVYRIDNLLRFILAWHPGWLDNEQEDELSITLPCEPQRVANRYQSYDDYVTTLWPLILIEFFAQMIRDYRERDKQPSDFKFESFEPDETSKGFRIVKCSGLRDNDASNGKDPGENDLVILRGGDEYITEAFGVVEEVEKTPLSDSEDDDGSYSFTLIRLRVKVASLNPSIRISSFQIVVVTSLVPLYRRWEALVFLRRSLLAPDILNPFRKQVYELSSNTSNGNDFGVKFNPGQVKAISTITSAVTEAYPLPRLRLLQGPPGTGKTHTLLGLIKNVLKSLAEREENPQILICTPSNAAIDSLVIRLMKDPPRLEHNTTGMRYKKRAHSNCGDFCLLRVGDSRQMSQRVVRYSLDHLADIEVKKQRNLNDPAFIKRELQKTLHKLKLLDKECTKLKMSMGRNNNAELKKKLTERTREQKANEYWQRKLKGAGQRRDLRVIEGETRASLLKHAHIICCTLSGAGSKHMVKSFGANPDVRMAPFSCVIIDEAGQCCEPDALIPLQYGASKLVLVGDPAQLPATILSQRAYRYGYGQSLFERIHRALMDHSESPVLSLQEQYRMHPAICAFPSQKFYEGNLFTAREVVQRRRIPGMKPFTVLNISDSEESRECEGAIHNPEERKYVIYICKDIIQKGKVKPEQIGVITPYRRQLQKLRSEMSTGLEFKVEVNTIDGFQGREKDIIILSCVRAQKTRTGVGFLQDPQRMNVALTRAKHSLIVLVHAESLQVDEDWKDLLDFSRSRGLLFNITSVDQIEAAVFSDTSVTKRQEDVEKTSKALKNNSEKKPLKPDHLMSPLRYEDLSDEEEHERMPRKDGHAGEKATNNVDVPEAKTDAHSISHGAGAGAANRPRLQSQRSKEHDIDGMGQHGVARHEMRFPHHHSDGTECKDKCLKGVSWPEVAESSSVQAQAEQVRRNRCSSHLPHKHSDGTECSEICVKASVSPGISPNAYEIYVAKYKKLPHTHSDGTECHTKCLKLKSKPSSSYYKLPHYHKDGTRCEDRCKRLEERERLRVAKEASAHLGSIIGETPQSRNEESEVLKSSCQEKRTAESSPVNLGIDATAPTAVDSAITAAAQPDHVTKSNTVPKSGSSPHDHNPKTTSSTERTADAGMSPKLSSAEADQARNTDVPASGDPPPCKKKKTIDRDSEFRENDLSRAAAVESSGDMTPPPLPPIQEPVEECRPPLPSNVDDGNEKASDPKTPLDKPNNSYDFIAESNSAQNELKLRAALYAKQRAGIDESYQAAAFGYGSNNNNPYNQLQLYNNQEATAYGQEYHIHNSQGVQGNPYVAQNVQYDAYMQSQFQCQGDPRGMNSLTPVHNGYTRTHVKDSETYPGGSSPVNDAVPVVSTACANNGPMTDESRIKYQDVRNEGALRQRNGGKVFDADLKRIMYGSEAPALASDQVHAQNNYKNQRVTKNIDDEIHRIRMATGYKQQKFDMAFVVVAEKRKNAEKAKRDQAAREEDSLLRGSSDKQPGRKAIPEGFFGSAVNKKPIRQPFYESGIKSQGAANRVNLPARQEEPFCRDGQFQNDDYIRISTRKRRRPVHAEENKHENGVFPSRVHMAETSLVSDQDISKRSFSAIKEQRIQSSGFDMPEEVIIENERHKKANESDFNASNMGGDAIEKFKLRDFRISLQRTDSFEQLQKKDVIEISANPTKRTVREVRSGNSHLPNMAKVEEIAKRIKEQNSAGLRRTQLIERQENRKMFPTRTFLRKR